MVKTEYNIHSFRIVSNKYLLSLFVCLLFHLLCVTQKLTTEIGYRGKIWNRNREEIIINYSMIFVAICMFVCLFIQFFFTQ